VDIEINKLNKLLTDDVSSFNRLILEKALPVIKIKVE